ncbi:PorV/PorQ family protein [Sphingobacteriales bacterium CHB3]|nr:PorV/PorQ family protein [Sphingobacteriales bacterium CHB3]
MYSNTTKKGETTMTKKMLISALVFGVLFAGVVGTADAQNKRTGTSAAPELLIPVGARYLAMGSSSLANSMGVEAVHYNPAGLGLLTRSAEGMFSSMSYIADINVTYGAVGASFGEFGVVGLSIKSLNFGDIPLTTNNDPENSSGASFSPTYVTVGATYARPLTDAISVGITAKLVTEQIDRVSATGVAFDFGVQYRGLVDVKGLALGVAVKNIGPGMKFDGSGLYRSAVSSDGSRPEQPYKSEAAVFDLPSLVEFGLAYSGNFSDELSYVGSGSFTNNNLYVDEWRMGGEVLFSSDQVRLAGRVGGTLLPNVEKEDRIFGITAGVGITYITSDLELTFDYAFRQVDLFNNNNVFSLKVGF